VTSLGTVDHLPQPAGSQPRPLSRPWIASLWLIFLVPAVSDCLRHIDEPRGMLGLVATLAFMALYTAAFYTARKALLHGAGQPPLRVAVGTVTALLTLATSMIALIGEDAAVSVVFVATTVVLVLPLVVAIPINLLAVAAVVALGLQQDWSAQGGVALGTFLGSLAIFGMRTVIARNQQLLTAHAENTRLAVDNERNRFARDLHDILGHSLTVITVKAELAQRLIDVDGERARHELADLERLSRDALADIRRAVEGYRELTLPGELARARAALAAAEITPYIPQSTEIVPTGLRELFAWSVREGVTNVIRHSGAGRCDILLSESCVEIRDDGSGPGASTEGSGLTGLRERAAAAGAMVTTRSLSPGFSLQVALP
jgi:two-component system, NarL family, sensor histidine kinase DesK